MPATTCFGINGPPRFFGGSAPPPPWTPSDAGPVLLQLDVEGSSVLWQDTAATTPATASGDPIRRWNATTGLNVTQSSAGAEPALAIVGGKKRVRFDGTNDRLTNTAMSFASGAKSWALCYQYRAALATTEVDCALMLGQPTSGGITRTLFLGPTHASAGINWNADTPNTATALVGSNVAIDTSPHALVVVYNGGSITSAASYKAWLDGSPLTVTARSSSLTHTTTSAVGAQSSGTNPCTIDVMGVLLWGAAISDANALAASSYLLGMYT